MTDKSLLPSLSAMNPSGLGLFADQVLAHASSNNLMTAWPEYLADTFQRSVLFLDLLRQRGNQQIEITSQPMATVLSFDHEELMIGKSLPRPINYVLSRIIPPPEVNIDASKRPVVVIDPRAGQGSGIGGFKAESEIGDALKAGHPTYFIGFSAIPEPGQTFLDVVEGQVKFFEHVVELHPDSPRPFAIGNCQAGYQTLMVAMLRPDLFGPCLVPGSPMSYWQGERGKSPMRYAGGLLGGSWLNALTSDLGKGKIDGTGLIANFDNLNPAYSLWGKQYDIYANIDSGADRYLKFEKWWGDFIELNGAELQYLVDNLFIGDKLTRNQLQSSDGITFDLRNVTSPIIVFTSTEDDISPPPQSLGWILDLYRNDEDICAADRTIVYCLNHDVGHLAIFVSSQVAAKQHQEFLQLMNVIDYLPPGLHEMVISPKPVGLAPGGFVTGDWFARFERRTLDDIRAVGRNSLEDDRAFAAVAKLSEINLSLYRTFMQPMVRALVTQPMADLTRALNPLRLSYTMFADTNPWMKGVQQLAASVAAARKPAVPDNPFLALQTQMSDQITTALDAYRAARDQHAEKSFFDFYGSPFVQALLGINSDSEVRPLPSTSPEKMAARNTLTNIPMGKMRDGGFNEALTRAVLYVNAADLSFDQRSAFALSAARQNLMQLSLADFKLLVRDQFFMLQLDCKCAVETLADLVPKAAARKELLKQVVSIVSAGEPPSSAERVRLDQLSELLAVPEKLNLSVIKGNAKSQPS